MLPDKIEITNEDISFAENILLPNENSFDQERKTFIKNLDTIDLQAVPGSGKTTTLLAKLLIIEKYLPFNDGSGILVISHTNAAIDEIKNKIWKHCPKLFSYPNFIGTIQAFVDNFLAKPYLSNQYRRKIQSIDNDIFLEKFHSKYPRKLRTALEYRLGINYNSFLFGLEINERGNIIHFQSGEELQIKNAGKTSQIHSKIINVKKWLVENGYLNYNDAYFYANILLIKYSQIIKIIQRRFRFIFVDEMQDMDKHQHDLLEKLFFTLENERVCTYQRIGDMNQAIHNDISSIDCWKPRENSLQITGSHRLTPEIANVVKYFGLTYQEINGLRESINIKPHLILFDNINVVLKVFTELIMKYQLNQVTHNNIYPFNAICWTTHKNNEDRENKIRLEDYFKEYERKIAKQKNEFENLLDYLIYYDRKDESSKSICNNLFDVFIKELRLEQRMNECGRNFTKNNFLKFLLTNFNEIYNEIRLKIYLWSIQISKGKINDVYNEIKEYSSNLMNNLFGSPNLKEETKKFIDGISQSYPEMTLNGSNNENNIYTNMDNNIRVKVGTVHSVKGGTHVATLYLESFYKRGRGNYESQRLCDQIKGIKNVSETIESISNSKDFVKQSTKMTYVGFSRPTHLLCFAIHKDRFPSDFESENWNIHDLTLEN